MEFEIYCDESLASQSANRHPFLMIGSLWLLKQLRPEIKTRIKALREKHRVWGEIKWGKVSPAKQDFYFDLVDLFLSYGLELRFRCLAVGADQVDMSWHDGDKGLGFYKLYYQMLHHWILDFNEYAVFCDLKTHRKWKRLAVLHDCLAKANLTSKIKQIQALPSKELVLIQLTDFLLGMAGARVNDSIKKGCTKDKVAQRLESRLDVKQLTLCRSKKFNIFMSNIIAEK